MEYLTGLVLGLRHFQNLDLSQFLVLFFGKPTYPICILNILAKSALTLKDQVSHLHRDPSKKVHDLAYNYDGPL